MGKTPDFATSYPTLKTVPKLLKVKESLDLDLVRRCVLPANYESHEKTDLAKAAHLQKRLRQQYYRLIDSSPEKRLEYTYRMHCPPLGFYMKPRSRVCNRPLTCPWCYVRSRIMPMYDAIMQVPADVRDASCIAIWKRHWPLGASLPFFDSRSGPHVLLKAHVTVQFATPVINLKGELVLQHCGLQLIPKTDQKAFHTFEFYPPLANKIFPDASDTTLLDALTDLGKLDWLVILNQDCLIHYQQMVHFTEKTRMYRVNKYKGN